MPRGIPYDRPTIKRTVRLFTEDVEKLKRFYPNGYARPLLLLIHRHVQDLEKFSKKEMERAGLSAEEIEAVTS